MLSGKVAVKQPLEARVRVRVRLALEGSQLGSAS
jgi:hypothetical protein